MFKSLMMMMMMFLVEIRYVFLLAARNLSYTKAFDILVVGQCWNSGNPENGFTAVV